MWADQVSSSDTASSHKKDPVTGYSVGQDEESIVKTETDGVADVVPAVAQEAVTTESPEGEAPVTLPTTEEPVPAPVSSLATESEEPVAVAEASEADKAMSVM